MADDITAKCPDCGSNFPLNEAVLGSLREHLTKELSSSVKEKEAQALARLEKARETEASLKKQQDALEDEVEKRLRSQLEKDREVLKKKALERARENEAARMKALQDRLDEKSHALKQAEEKELSLLKREEQLSEEAKKVQLNVQRQLTEERGKIEEKVAKQEAERQSLKQAEIEKKLTDAVKMNDELRQKLEQGSQQTQGEILELQLENNLRHSFPLDQFSEVPKGIRGADLVHHVSTPAGKIAGTILYETKQTKSWSKDWIPKLKEDLVKAKADIPVLITHTLPEGIDSFSQIDGVWVCPTTHVTPLVHLLTLCELYRSKAAVAGMEDNKDLLYTYFTGPEFRNRLETIVTTFNAMRQTLEQEKRALTKHWAAREKQIDKVVLHLTGMDGDIQGISGNKFNGLELLDVDDMS